MKIDVYSLELEMARAGKKVKELGIDPRTYARLKAGKDLKPLTVCQISTALGVDPERITAREVNP
jgi:hypothetical protein